MARFDIQDDVQLFLHKDDETGFHISGSSLILNRPIEFLDENGVVELILNTVTYTVYEDDLGVRRLSMTGDVDKRFNGVGRVICSLHLSQSANPIPFMDRGFHQIPNIESGPFKDTDHILKLVGNPAKYAKRMFFTARLNRITDIVSGQEPVLARASG